jgi:hypothetical protein
MVTFRLALLAHEIRSDPFGVSDIMGIVERGSRNVCEQLPATLRYSLVFWCSGKPGETFEATVGVAFNGQALGAPLVRTGEIPESGLGVFPVGPIEVNTTRPGRYSFDLAIDGHLTYDMTDSVELAAPSTSETQ